MAVDVLFVACDIYADMTMGGLSEVVSFETAEEAESAIRDHKYYNKGEHKYYLKGCRQRPDKYKQIMTSKAWAVILPSE